MFSLKQDSNVVKNANFGISLRNSYFWRMSCIIICMDMSQRYLLTVRIVLESDKPGHCVLLGAMVLPATSVRNHLRWNTAIEPILR